MEVKNKKIAIKFTKDEWELIFDAIELHESALSFGPVSPSKILVKILVKVPGVRPLDHRHNFIQNAKTR